MQKPLTATVAVLIMAGCAPAPFIVVDQSASTASFTVIPADEDTDFSRGIEREILHLGLRVVERPPLRFLDSGTNRTETRSAGVVGLSESGVGVSGGHALSITRPSGLIDFVAMYPDASADYIVVTYSDSRELRIIRKKDLSLVGSGVVSARYDTLQRFVASVLANAGLVSDKYFVKQCKDAVRIRKH
ncbi:MAG: hypothetical protein NTY77_07455 [Elusimicrobia bacterium]|nr:hypothetical protein [Elusimicrobiota bacterium]